jgi:hypothetical protein
MTCAMQASITCLHSPPRKLTKNRKMLEASWNGTDFSVKGFGIADGE